MTKTDILPSYSKILTTQQYGSSIPIDGVKFVPLKYNRGDGGEFTELARIKNGKLEIDDKFQLAQISMSVILPGTIKAFHLHFDQSDAWFVSPHDRLLVGLADTRKSSPTANQTMRFILGAGAAQLLIIPAGVAHGAANLWDKPTTMFYFTDKQFSSQNPDERRLPFDLFGSDFWKLKNG